MMVKAGKAHLIETLPGEAGQVCVFESVAGEQFPIGPLRGSLARPALSEEAEAEVREIVREILEEEG
jgi:hypothetical protein